MDVFLRASTKNNSREIIELNRKLNKNEKRLVNKFLDELLMICSLKKDMELVEYKNRIEYLRKISDGKLYSCHYDGHFSIIYLGTIEDVNSMMVELGHASSLRNKDTIDGDMFHGPVEIEYNYEENRFYIKTKTVKSDVSDRISEIMTGKELDAVSHYLELMRSDLNPQEKRLKVMKIKTGRIDRLYKKYPTANYITILLRSKNG